MRLAVLSFLVLLLVSTFLASAGEVEKPSIFSQATISQFNIKVSQAATKGEKWPCSPFVLTQKFMALQSAEGMGGDPVYCRDSESDTMAIIVVRNKNWIASGNSEWIDLKFHKLPDNTWRLFGTKPTVHAFASLPLRGPRDSSSKQSLGGNVFPSSDIEYDHHSHGQVRYSEEKNGVRVELVGWPNHSFTYTQPDSSVPIGNFFTGTPSPHSGQRAQFAILGSADITITVRKGKRGDFSTYLFKEVAPGPYLLELGGPNLEPGGYLLQVWYNGEPTSIKVVYVH